MKKFGRELEFISFIKRDGSGVVPCGTEWNADKDYPKVDDMSYLDNYTFKVRVLSITHKTYIASSFNTWVVKLKEENGTHHSK